MAHETGLAPGMKARCPCCGFQRTLFGLRQVNGRPQLVCFGCTVAIDLGKKAQ